MSRSKSSEHVPSLDKSNATILAWRQIQIKYVLKNRTNKLLKQLRLMLSTREQDLGAEDRFCTSQTGIGRGNN